MQRTPAKAKTAWSAVPTICLLAATFAGAAPPLTEAKSAGSNSAGSNSAGSSAAGSKPASEAESKLGSKWIRVTEDDHGEPRAMQTAVVTYGAPGRALLVDLIGAVHVGDAAYYAGLNQRFREYEALLYELVAPEGTIVPRAAKAENRSPLGMIQGGMGAILELEHQLEKVDYTRSNFVHADMSPQELFKTMEERGESVITMMMQLMAQSPSADDSKEGKEKAAKQNADLIVALFSKDRARRLKTVLAQQFADSELLLTSFGGEGGSTIIHERNKRALDVLRQQIQLGRTRLGVFYGAGHLIDMHQRLVKEFGLEPKSIEWVTAWNLRPEK